MWVLQNTSWCGLPYREPTIRITDQDPEWEQAHQRWRDMKDPTDSPLWKQGVFLHWE